VQRDGWEIEFTQHHCEYLAVPGIFTPQYQHDQIIIIIFSFENVSGACLCKLANIMLWQSGESLEGYLGVQLVYQFKRVP